MPTEHPLRVAGDTVDGNSLEGGISETMMEALVKRTALVLGPAEVLGDIEQDDGEVALAVIHGATGSLYFLDLTDTTTPDDGLTCLVDADGNRYRLSDQASIQLNSVLGIENDPPGSPSLGDAYVVDTSPTGAWASHAGDVALNTKRGWVFASPTPGLTLLNEATDQNIQYSAAGAWGGFAASITAGSVFPASLLFPMGVSVQTEQDAPPGGPSAGEHYLVGSSPSGAWAGQAGKVAYYTAASAWAFLSPYGGARIYNLGAQQELIYNADLGAWAAVFAANTVCNGRLTLESGVPVSTSDQTAKTTLYFTPFRGNSIALYVSGGWVLRTFTERSLSLSGFTSGKPFDIWAYDDSGTVTLEALVWTDDTTRATALALQDGIYVKSGDATRRYLGTIYTSATGQCEDSAAKRYVFNATNRVERPMRVLEATNSWAYTTDTWRQANGSTANQIDLVLGLIEDMVSAEVVATLFDNSVSDGSVAIGLNSTSAVATGGLRNATGSTESGALVAKWRGYPVAGRNYLAWLERADGGTATWRGDNGDVFIQSGISGSAVM